MTCGSVAALNVATRTADDPPQAAPGHSCASLRVWGSCYCDDGRPVPGCSAEDSSSWSPLDGGSSGGETLPKGLSLPCVAVVVAPEIPTLPLPPQPPRPMPPEHSGGDGSGGRGDGLSTGALAGIVVGAVVGGSTLVAIAVWFGCMQVC